MNQTKRISLLSPIFLILGVVAMALNRWLFTRVEDEVSLLLPAFTLPEILLWALIGAAAIAALVLTRRTVLQLEGRVFPAVCSVLMAGGVATLLLEEAKGPEALVLVYRGMCVLGAVCLVAAAFFQGIGRRVPFLLELPVCVMLVTHLLICYQLWSEVPQMMNYALGLGAVLCLTMAGFFRLSWAAGLPGKPWQNALGLMGVFFCAAAVSRGGFTWFFTAAAIWLAGMYSGLRPAER